MEMEAVVLDQSTYTFRTLSKKYEDFRAPAFSILVGGKTLNSSELPIVSLEVDLSADGSAGGCRFAVESLYDYEQYQWRSQLAKTIQVGAKLEVKAGYVKQETVFYGYVDEYSLSYRGDGPPLLEVVGIDGLGYLMSCQEPLYGEKKPPRKVVEEILQKSVSAGYAKRCTVGRLDGFTTPLLKERIDDFKYLKLLAERYCMSLLAVDGELIFDDVSSNTKSLLTLTIGAGLLEFGTRQSLRGQVGRVEVWGRDEKQQFIQGSAENVTVGGRGKTAVQIAPKFRNAVRREYSEYVRTEAECVRMAQARLNTIALNFVSGKGTCVGIPELIPGRYVTIAGLDGDTEGDYFLTQVHHRFSSNGYFTEFAVKGAKA